MPRLHRIGPAAATRDPDNGGTNPKLIYGTAFALAAAALVLVSNRTLGLVDEIYYLWWIGSPTSFDASIHPFGILLHPIYEVVGRSIVGLRVIGTLSLAVSGLVLGSAVRDFYRIKQPGDRFDAMPIAGMLFALLYYVIWILTPNYNLLANVGGALVAAGLFWWAQPRRGARRDMAVSVLVGLGGAICFFGKPTFALVAGAAAAIVWAMAARRAPARAATRAAAAAGTAVVVTIATIHAVMPVPEFVASVRTGLAILNFGNSPAALPLKTLRELVAAPPYVFVSVAVAAITVVVCRRRDPSAAALRSVRRLNWGWLVVLMAISAGLLALSVHRHQSPWYFVGAPALALTIGWISACLSQRENPDQPVGSVGPMIVLLAIPFATAFGTANELIFQTGLSLYAWAMAAALATAAFLPRRYRTLADGALAAGCVAVLTWSAAIPFDLPASVIAQRVPVTTRFSPDTLLVDRRTADDVRRLQTIGRNERIDADTPILDLSGAGPFNAAMLGGRPPFFPWLVPQYDNAALLAGAAWDGLGAADQRRAWIIGPAIPAFRASPTIARILRQHDRHEPAARIAYSSRGGTPPVTLWRPSPVRAATEPPR